jgi:hypothetical protein
VFQGIVLYLNITKTINMKAAEKYTAEWFKNEHIIDVEKCSRNRGHYGRTISDRATAELKRRSTK